MEQLFFIDQFDNKHLINSLKHYRQVALICDHHVHSLYGQCLQKVLEPYTQVHCIQHHPGEKHKTRETKAQIEDTCAQLGFNQLDAIVSLGGGLTLDLGGFVAATYHRGISSYYIPTTLLACIDACIGGKVAINTPYGKNLIGTFYSAKAVFIPEFTLKTLTQQQTISGYMEAVKTLSLNAHHSIDIHSATNDTTSLIKNCLKIKSSFVSKDPKDKRFRKFLNFGHTIGHGIEKASNYSIDHGIAIGHGMILETKIMQSLKMSSPQLLKNLLSYTRHYQLPLIQLPSIEKIISFCLQDKKNSNKIELVHLIDWQKPNTINPTYSIDLSTFQEKLIEALADYQC